MNPTVSPDPQAGPPPPAPRKSRDNTLRRLTVSQEKFCQNLLLGMSGTKAYRDAFPLSGEHAAPVNACLLQKRPHVARRLAELRADEERTCLMKRARRLERLREIAESADSNTRDIISAIKTINDMAGDGDPRAAESPDASAASLLSALRRVREQAS